jgi:hypothetical protein
MYPVCHYSNNTLKENTWKEVRSSLANLNTFINNLKDEQLITPYSKAQQANALAYLQANTAESIANVSSTAANMVEYIRLNYSYYEDTKDLQIELTMLRGSLLSK